MGAEEALNNARRDVEELVKHAIKRAGGKVGLYIKDMAAGEIIERSADDRFPAASIIKVPVLIEALRQVEAGSLNLEEQVAIQPASVVGGTGVIKELKSVSSLSLLDLLTLMIVVSDNTATNICIDRVGMEAVNRLLERYGLAKTSLQRKMMDLAARKRGIDNWTTPREIGRLLELVLSAEILSSEKSRLALDIMARQQVNDRIPLYLPEGTRVAHKTGELSGTRHDAGVVFHTDRMIILVALTTAFTDPASQKFSGGEASSLIADISRCVYQAVSLIA